MPAKKGCLLDQQHEGGLSGWNFRARGQQEARAGGYCAPALMLLHITVLSGCSASSSLPSSPVKPMGCFSCTLGFLSQSS